MKNQLLFLALLLMGAAFTSCETNSNETGWKMNFTPAKTMEEFKVLRHDDNANIIRSNKDFDAFVSSNSKLSKYFDDEMKKNFIQRLKFNDGGLQTFSYQALKEKYPNDIPLILPEILKGFGIAASAVTTLDDKYCHSVATCKSERGSVCVADNC